jgi:N-acetyl-anhydromuramyl-L-alanine amidase AmpD
MSRAIRKIIVHCTASPDSLDIGAAEIRDWHVNGNGWSDIGYHWVVRRDGTIESGRPEERSGAHVKGHNSDSIGIVWVGTNKCEDKQLDALITKVKELCYRYNIDSKEVYGHYELYSGKTCPNLKMDDFRKSLSHKENSTASQGDLLPDGPSEEDMEISLEEIEKDILGDDML